MILLKRIKFVTDVYKPVIRLILKIIYILLTPVYTFLAILRKTTLLGNRIYAQRVKELFKCNICLEMPNEPISTNCGHVFCYVCFKNNINVNNFCPVCRKEVDECNFIPIFTRNKTIDIRNKTAMKNVNYRKLVDDYENLLVKITEKHVEKKGYFVIKESKSSFIPFKSIDKQLIILVVLIGISSYSILFG